MPVLAAGLLSSLSIGCGGEGSSGPGDQQETRGALGGPTVTTNQTSYATSGTITVSYSALPGNFLDWIALAPAGSPNTTYTAFVYTRGLTAGTATFATPAPGSYVVRAFANNVFVLLAESATLTVANTATVGATQPSFGLGTSVTVNYAGLPGNAQDWIAIAAPGAATGWYVALAYTGGQTSGTATFANLLAGSYVARAFAKNTFTLLAESPMFIVASTASVGSSQTTFGIGTTVTVNYAGLPGNTQDWIALAVAGAPNASYVAWVYTGGQTGGTVTFPAQAAGNYVARAFAKNSLTLLAQSPIFTVGNLATVGTDSTVYAPGATITVTYDFLPGNAKDWIAIAPAGAPNTTYTAWVYTGGLTSGVATFTAPTSGSYVARAFLKDTPTLLAESAAFTCQLPLP